MQLLYLNNAESSHHIIKGEYNFSNQFNIRFDKKLETLIIEDNPQYIKNFWGNNIKNVSVLIGQNGSGKTQLFNYLELFYGSFRSSDMAKNILMYQNENDEYIVLGNLTNDNIKKPENLLIQEIKPFPLSFGYDVISHKTTFISFSNKFDAITKATIGHTFNISTEALLVKDFEDHTQKNRNRRDNMIALHKAGEMKRQLYFLLNGGQEYYEELGINRDFRLEIKIPDTFYDINDYTLNNYNAKSAKEKALDKKYNELKKNILIYGDQRIPDDSRSNFLFQIHREILINFLVHYIDQLLISSPSQNAPLDKIVEAMSPFFSAKNKSQKKVIDLNKLYKDLHSHIPSNLEFNHIKEQFNDYLLFINALEPYLTPVNFFVGNLSIPIKADINILFDLYAKSEELVPYLIFDWGGFSSGESAMLNLYSRFHSITMNDKGIYERNNDIIIFFDECNLYLHPDWERKFMLRFVDYIQKKFGVDENRIQIILSTHSPIILSDIPNSFIIYMTKGSPPPKDLTWGSNIYSLFNHSFFITEGLIGELAKQKINNIIDSLQREADIEDIEIKNNIKKQIAMIGEPIVQNYLEQLFQEKYFRRQ